jgi:hypothetical protein
MSSKTVGEIIDEIYTVRALRLNLEKEIATLKKRESDLSKFVGDELIEMGSTAMRGNIANFSYKVNVIPKTEDWNRVYEFVKKEDAFGLLGRSISVPVWREYKEHGLLVPGTAPIEMVKYSITKASR